MGESFFPRGRSTSRLDATDVRRRSPSRGRTSTATILGGQAMTTYDAPVRFSPPRGRSSSIYGGDYARRSPGVPALQPSLGSHLPLAMEAHAGSVRTVVDPRRSTVVILVVVV